MTVERKPLTVYDIAHVLANMPHTRKVLVDQVDGIEENFSEANYVKVVEFGGETYLAIGRTMRPDGVG